LPTGLPCDLDLATVAREVGAQVVERYNRDPARKGPQVSSWMEIPYRDGASGIAGVLDVILGRAFAEGVDLGWRRMFVDPAHPAAAEVLAVLASYPQHVLVVRAVSR